MNVYDPYDVPTFAGPTGGGTEATRERQALPHLHPLHEQCNAALELYGKCVRFAHHPDDTTGHRVIEVTSDCMLKLNDMVGEFAPHLFVKLP
jgi:hypothetical protein